MDSVVFYDGYAETVDTPAPKGIIRLNNAVQAVRLTDAQLDVIQPNLEMQVLIDALCDNYDRIGSVNLALTPKGLDSDVPGEVDRIEVARFITPFMNMNRQPDTARYEWDIDGVSAILTDPALRGAQGASDEMGTTTKTIEFELEEDAAHAQLVLITSKHGANAGGEDLQGR